MMRKSLTLLAVLGLLAGVALAACTGSPQTGTQSFAGPPYTLRVLASNELADLRPLLTQAAKATGVTVDMTFTDSLHGSDQVVAGEANGHYDADWFATNRYLAMNPKGLSQLDDVTATMSSPVILGVRASVAHALGWDSKPVTWQDILTAIVAHRFAFGMADPDGSNSGLTGLVSVATAITGRGAALTGQEITQAAPQLAQFFAGQSLKVSSTEALTSTYVRDQGGQAQGDQLDGLIDYESALLELNASHQLREPLALVYPSDGVVTSDYTFSELTSAPRAAKNAYRRLAAYLLTPDVQRQIMQQTRRRPIIPQVRPDVGFGRQQLFELPFPGTAVVIDDLESAYYRTLRRPARTVYVLDTSGSMANAPINELKSALVTLIDGGGDTAIEPREQVTMVPFNATPAAPATFTVPASDPQPVLDQIVTFAGNLKAQGRTAIYDALVTAYQVVESESAGDPNRITTIVLLTDGENNTGDNLAVFQKFYNGLSPAIQSVPVFPILFGSANTLQMGQLAQLTGGTVFDGRHLPLATVFQLVRGDQ